MQTPFLELMNRKDRPRRRPLAVIALVVLSLCTPQALPAQVDWVLHARPATPDLVKIAFADDIHGWVVGDSGTILATDDGGATWSAQASPVPFDLVDVDMLNERWGWILAQQFPSDETFDYGTTLLRTTNGGVDWLAQATFPFEFLHAVDFTDSLRGCVGGDGGRLLRTPDGGRTWLPALVDWDQYARWPVREIDFYSPMYGIAMGGFYDVTGLVWRTTNGGKFWTHRRVASEPLFASHFFDSLDVLCVGGDLDYGSGMVRTTDAGSQWEYTYLGIWGQASGLSFRTPTEGWAPLGFAGTYMMTRDAGRTWSSANTPGRTPMADVAFIDDRTGYMVGAGGIILKFVGASTAIGSPDPDRLAPSVLVQNSPNPVQSRTEFEYRIPEFGFVSLKIYDLAGREVATLVNQHLAAGTYSLSFDRRDLASGVYYYRLATAGHVATRKMLLIR